MLIQPYVADPANRMLLRRFNRRSDLLFCAKHLFVAANCQGCSQLQSSADAITAALAPAGRTPTVLGDSSWCLVGAGDAVAATRHPARRAPLAGLFRLRQLLGPLSEGERRQQHSRNDQSLQHGECLQLGHSFVTTLARLRAISIAVLTGSSRLFV